MSLLVSFAPSAYQVIHVNPIYITLSELVPYFYLWFQHLYSLEGRLHTWNLQNDIINLAVVPELIS